MGQAIASGFVRKLFKLQILAGCLILCQPVQAQVSCKVQLGHGRAFTEGDAPLELKILALNGKDVFVREAAVERGDERQLLASDRKFQFKNTALLDWQREIVNNNDPDIIILTEVHKDEDMKKFMQLDTLGLKDKYYNFLKEGNSNRGINIGISVKKDLGFKFKLVSHKHLKWTDPVTKAEYPLFARDIPALIMTRPGDDKPALIVMGNHAKSKRDNPGDKESTRYRTAQYEGMKKIIDDFKAEYGEDIPMILAGDFNTDVTTAPEMKSIRTAMKSIFDSIPGKVFSAQERITHFFFGQGGNSFKQMDDIRLAGKVKAIFAAVLKYKKANGEEIPDPKSFKERELLPSDHRPVFATIQIEMPKAKQTDSVMEKN